MTLLCINKCVYIRETWWYHAWRSLRASSSTSWTSSASSTRLTPGDTGQLPRPTTAKTRRMFFIVSHSLAGSSGECAAQRGDVLTQPLQLFSDPWFILKGSRWPHTHSHGWFKKTQNWASWDEQDALLNTTCAKVRTTLGVSQGLHFLSMRIQEGGA